MRDHVDQKDLRKQGRGLGRPQTSSRRPPPPPVISDRPKAAPLFWFFGDFRCGTLLFVVIHVLYKYINR